MANRDVTVRLRAEIGNYEAAMKRAANVTQEVATSGQGAFDKLVQKQREHEQSWNTLANTALVAGGGMVATMGTVTKAAISWESAWAGVKKTTDGTPEQMAALEAELRGLARTLPATHEEIAGVAEAAGQLGIKRENVAAFTKTMIDMGESTNLSADEAATSIARFTNIMGSVGKHGEEAYSRVGSAMVALGNNFATTESEINSMAMRLAGAGAQINMTEGDVLGLAAAMSSVGIEAEAGGTAMSTVMKKVDSAVRDGGDSLADFAKVAGLSAEEFAAKWRSSPSAALDLFVQGLGKVKESGGSVSETLTELGIKGIREQDTMLRLAGAAGILGDALATGNEGFKQNSALIDEATQRYQTAESRIKIAWNGIKDSAITAGAVMLPVVANIADGVAKTAEAIGSLPAPVLGATTAIAGLAGGGLLLVGGLMKAVTFANDVKTAADNLGISLGKADGKMGAFAKGVGAFAVSAAVAIPVLDKLFEGTESAAIGAAKMGNALADPAAGIDNLNAAFRNAEWANGNGSWWQGSIDGINGVGDAIANVQSLSPVETFGSWGASMVGISDNTAKLKEDIASLDSTLAGMVQGGSMEQAQDAFRQIGEDTKKAGGDVGKLAEQFPQLKNAVLDYASSLGVTLTEQETLAAMMGEMPPALRDAAAAAESTDGAMSSMGEALAEVGAEAEETKLDIDELVDAFRVLGNIHMNESEAMGNYHNALAQVRAELAATGAALDATGTRFDTQTEAGQRANAMMAETVDAAWKLAEAQARAGASTGELQGTLQGAYSALVESAMQMGLTAEQADLLATKVLGVPDGVSIESWMSDTAYKLANDTAEAAEAIPDSVHVESSMSEAARAEAEATRGALDNVPKVLSVTSAMEANARTEADMTRTALGMVPTSHYTSSSMGADARLEADSTKAAVDNIPNAKGVSLTATADARLEADATKRSIDAIPAMKRVAIETTRSEVIKQTTLHSAVYGGKAFGGLVGAGLAGGGMPADVRGFARGGGLLPGVPPATQWVDNLPGVVMDTGEPIMLRSREFVVNEPGTHRGANLAWLRWMNAGGTMHTPPAPRGFAAGGMPAAITTAHTQTAGSADPGAIAGAVRAGLQGIAVQMNFDGHMMYGYLTDLNRRYERA